MPTTVTDIVGEKFGRLTGKATAGRHPNGRRYYWTCVCLCGGEVEVSSSNLRSGGVKSCGCLRSEKAAHNCRDRSTHGQSKTPEFRAWVAMRSRCSDPGVESYPDYGGRGIAVCDRWLNSFENFLADMGPRPSSRHTLERVENEKNYAPDNCVWTTMVNQQNNKRNTFFVTYKGERIALGIAMRRAGCTLQHSTVHRRIQYGWDVEEALNTPLLRAGRR